MKKSEKQSRTRERHEWFRWEDEVMLEPLNGKIDFPDAATVEYAARLMDQLASIVTLAVSPIGATHLEMVRAMNALRDRGDEMKGRFWGNRSHEQTIDWDDWRKLLAINLRNLLQELEGE